MPGWLILMGALTAIGPFSIDMYLPAFPSIAAGLGVERGEVERTLAAYLIGMAGRRSSMARWPTASRPQTAHDGRAHPVRAGLAGLCADRRHQRTP